MRRRRLLSTLLCIPTSFSNAQTSRKVVWVVPFAPGGGTDLFVRPLITALNVVGPEDHIIDYRPGAGGRIGAAFAARADPNGQTVFVGSVHHVVGQLLFPSEGSELLTAFEPVIKIASVPDVLVVPASIGVKDVDGLLSYATANKNSLAFASSGIGTTRHVLGEVFNRVNSLGAVHIPYSGSGPAIRALLAAETHYMFEGVGPALPHIRSGSLRALAISHNRVPTLPGVPTFEEIGIKALAATSWYGIFLPRQSNHNLVSSLNERIVKMMHNEIVRESLQINQAVFSPHMPLDFAIFIREEVLRWSQLVKSAEVAIR